MTHTPVSTKSYLVVFFSLMALLGISIGVGYINLGALNLAAAMCISVAKTVLIILFFMHVRQASKLNKLLVCVGFFWLAIMLCLAMGDYLSRHW
jgi:cytochrome c oxidase subunit IV